jgi:putative ABC transport system permease protein
VGTTPDFLSPRGTVLLSRGLYREKWRDSHLTHVLLTTAEGTSITEVRRHILAALGSRHRVRVLEPGELIDWFASQARRAFSALDVLGVLVLVVVLVGVGDALAAGTLERTGELGVLRAMGVRRNRIRKMILIEAVVLGLLGTLAALFLGVGLGVMWVAVTFPSLLGWTLSLHLPIGHIAGMAVAAVGICLIAAYGPAVRAARLDPVIALRTE